MAIKAANSPVAICNLALDHLNQDEITSIDPPTSDREVVCARWYDNVRRATLRSHVWNFAKARVELAANSIAPAFGYSTAYDFPADFIRFLFIGDDSVSDYRQRYEIEGKQILINDSDGITIGYIKSVTDVNQFDALFVDLFAIKLALRIAYKFTVKNTVVDRVKDLMIDIEYEAKGVDGQERPPKRIERSKFRNARQHATTNVAGKNTIFDI